MLGLLALSSWKIHSFYVQKIHIERPQFEDIKSYDEFAKYYWYLDELKAICKGLWLEYVGGKIELNNIIKSYFNGAIIPHKPKTTAKSKVNTLTLESKPFLADTAWFRSAQSIFERVYRKQ